jgi:hypothetical protein
MEWGGQPLLSGALCRLRHVSTGQLLCLKPATATDPLSSSADPAQEKDPPEQDSTVTENVWPSPSQSASSSLPPLSVSSGAAVRSAHDGHDGHGSIQQQQPHSSGSDQGFSRMQLHCVADTTPEARGPETLFRLCLCDHRSGGNQDMAHGHGHDQKQLDAHGMPFAVGAAGPLSPVNPTVISSLSLNRKGTAAAAAVGQPGLSVSVGAAVGHQGVEPGSPVLPLNVVVSPAGERKGTAGDHVRAGPGPGAGTNKRDHSRNMSSSSVGLSGGIKAAVFGTGSSRTIIDTSTKHGGGAARKG